MPSRSKVLLVGGACLLACSAIYAGILLIQAEGNLTFLKRAFVWNQSDVGDYQKFPKRAIANAAPAFNFKTDLQPSLFKDIAYTADGETRRGALDDFLPANNTTAFIVIKDDAILYENYFNGNERESIVTSFSTAKSFDSALMGIAIDEGYIGSIEDPVIKYVPEIKGRGLDKLTIRHLLTMSTGIRYVSNDELFPLLQPVGDDARTYYFPDLRHVAMSVQRSDEPIGAYFRYNNYHPLLEGLIIERATGRHVAEYLQEKIWKPLGMEFPASWSIDSEQSGFEKMESGINGRAIDFAKVGRLFNNKGNWNGKQIISEHWVTESTTPDPNDNRPWKVFTAVPSRNGYYKYHWWGSRRANGLYDFYAAGHLGQYLFIRPDENLVIVRYGIDEGHVNSWPGVFQSIANQIAGEASAGTP